VGEGRGRLVGSVVLALHDAVSCREEVLVQPAASGDRQPQGTAHAPAKPHRPPHPCPGPARALPPGTIMSYALDSSATEDSQRVTDFNHFVIFDPRNLLVRAPAVCFASAAV